LRRKQGRPPSVTGATRRKMAVNRACLGVGCLLLGPSADKVKGTGSPGVPVKSVG
jgi:hypothetical protein